MIQSQDYTASIAETKSQRKELKLKPSVAKAVREAAEAVGMDMSTFMASVSYRAAQEVQRSMQVSDLPEAQFQAFAAAVDGPGLRNEALAALIAKRNAVVKDG